MKKLLKHKWNKLHPCEKKAVVVAGVLAVALFTIDIALEIHDMNDGGAN